MQGAILNKGESYYTNLKAIFMKLNNFQTDYNWLISNAECYPSNKIYAEMLSEKICWLKGDQLTELIQEEFQWAWGVLSGFEKSVSFEEIITYEIPYADGNENLWKNPIALQHPLAIHEIIAWDSSLTIIKSKDSKIVNDFMKNYPLSQKLEDYNSSF